LCIKGKTPLTETGAQELIFTAHVTDKMLENYYCKSILSLPRINTILVMTTSFHFLNSAYLYSLNNISDKPSVSKGTLLGITEPYLIYCGLIKGILELCEISSSHGGEYDVQSCLLGCTAM
jgi:hypothetical protein